MFVNFCLLNIIDKVYPYNNVRGNISNIQEINPIHIDCLNQIGVGDGGLKKLTDKIRIIR
jgi:hypothetical protein